MHAVKLEGEWVPSADKMDSKAQNLLNDERCAPEVSLTLNQAFLVRSVLWPDAAADVPFGLCSADVLPAATPERR